MNKGNGILGVPLDVDEDKLGSLFRRTLGPCTTMDNFHKSLARQFYRGAQPVRGKLQRHWNTFRWNHSICEQSDEIAIMHLSNVRVLLICRIVSISCYCVWTDPSIIRIHREDRRTTNLCQGRVGCVPLSSGYSKRGCVADKAEGIEERHFPLQLSSLRHVYVPLGKKREGGERSATSQGVSERWMT